MSPVELDVNFEPRPASVPTTTPAGSWERIEIYRQRYLRGAELFHADDANTIIAPVVVGVRGPSAIRQYHSGRDGIEVA
jgi:hypothetical protein